MANRLTFETVTIPAALERLRAVAPSGRMLSAYLDVSPRRQPGRGYRTAFQGGCKTVRAALDPAERARLDEAVAVADRLLTTAFTPRRPGLALFVAPGDHLALAVDLPLTPPEGVAWDERPHLEPLEEIADNAERVAVALFDKERTRLFTIWLGEIEEHRVFEDEVPGKQATGGWFALAQTRYARHHEVHVLRHVRRTTDALLEILQNHPFDRLFLAGPDEAIALLRHHLPRPLTARLAGTLRLEVFASDAEVLAAVRAAAEEIERQQEVRLVEELIDGATGQRVALDFAPTLAALNEGRVHRLVLADSFAGRGGECGNCGRLTPGLGPCPTCGAATRPLADLAEAVLAQARAQGARVEIVTGEAAARLMQYNGLGAWTRY